MNQAYPEHPPPADAIPLGNGAWVALRALQWTYTTARGPGGQHVNKASTAAVLRVALASLGGLNEAALWRLRTQAGHVLVNDDQTLLFRCDLHRSQQMNRDACLERLRALVSRAALPPKVRKKTKPTRGSIERRLEGKKRASARKRDRGWRGE